MNDDTDNLIFGMKFHVSGKELKERMAQRATWHAERVTELLKQRDVAADALETAAKAAESAGSARSGRGRVVKAAVASSMTLGGGAPRRNYGEDMEDPVSAIDQAIDFHTIRGAMLKFYSEHLREVATYVLSQHEVEQYELVAAAVEED